MSTGPNIGMNYDAAKITKPAVSSPQSPNSVYQIKQRKQYTIQRKREKWSKDEHKKFMDAIEKFGRNWKKVEEIVRTKTRKQIRSHAQKHFDKMKKIGENFPPPRAKKRANHPYPSRKTSELFAMYAKSAQLQHQQHFALQLQSFKREPGEAEPNYERIFGFLTSLFKPSEYPNHQELLRPLSAVDKKCLRLLMHNLAVILSREQMQESQFATASTPATPFQQHFGMPPQTPTTSDHASSPQSHDEMQQQMYNAAAFNPYMAYYSMMPQNYYDAQMMQYYAAMYPGYFYGMGMDEENYDNSEGDDDDDQDEEDDFEAEEDAKQKPPMAPLLRKVKQEEQ